MFANIQSILTNENFWYIIAGSVGFIMVLISAACIFIAETDDDEDYEDEYNNF